jgi:succinyl-diaminopimelate desuccinylase
MKDYLEILDTYKEEMVETLRELCRFPSVAEETDPSAESPFGPAVQGALDYMLDKAARDGFAVKNVDNYGGHIDFPGKNATAEDPGDIVALVGHLDVVPVGDLSQWESDPFEMEIRDGKMYGRGTVDDKGPLLAAYFAVRALKEAGFVPEKTIRIMLGCDEETNWDGMTYYMEHEKVTPVSGFSPDAMFPVLYAEKGCLAFEVEGTFKESPSGGLRLVSVKGGSVVNAVPDKAEAVIEGTPAEVDAVRRVVGTFLAVHPDFGADAVTITEPEAGTPEAAARQRLQLTFKGIPAHAAFPETGRSAVAMLCECFSGLPFASKDVNRAVRFFNDHIGYDYNGQRIGLAMADAPSGKLTFNAGLIEMDEAHVKWTIDVRHPVTTKAEDVLAKLQAAVAEGSGEGDYTVTLLRNELPLYKPADDPMIMALLDSYKEFTGDTAAKPIAIGGATYARAVPNTVGFGPIMPGEPDMCHQANEFFSLDGYYTSAKIYAAAVKKLAE